VWGGCGVKWGLVWGGFGVKWGLVWGAFGVKWGLVWGGVKWFCCFSPSAVPKSWEAADRKRAASCWYKDRAQRTPTARWL